MDKSIFTDETSIFTDETSIFTDETENTGCLQDRKLNVLKRLTNNIEKDLKEMNLLLNYFIMLVSSSNIIK